MRYIMNSTSPLAYATDEALAAPAEPAAPEAAKKARQAEHELLGPNGDVVEEMHLATGIRYTDKATSAAFSWQAPNGKAGDPLTMFAIFGARTRATNAASAARQARGRDKSVTTTDVQWIEATFAETIEGQWSAPSIGVKSPRFDLDKLAEAIVTFLARGGKTFDQAKVRAKIGDDLPYRAGAAKNADVMAEYLRLTATGSTVDELSAGLE